MIAQRDLVSNGGTRNRRRPALSTLLVLLIVGALACGELDDPPHEDAELALRLGEDSAHAGERHPRGERPLAIGTMRIAVTVAEGRVVPVQLWYPADKEARRESSRGRPLLEIEPEPRERALLAQLLATAPAPGTSHVMHAADAPAPRSQRHRFPLIVFSHCTDCVRYSTLTVAEELARRGFVVAAPDHVRNTFYDLLQGTSVGLDLVGFLPQRVADMDAVLDTLLDPNAAALPEGLRGRIDSERVGAYGHSFGGLTTGLLVEQDARVRAGLALAVPIAIPLGTEDQYPPGARLADISRMNKPFMFIVAAEDAPFFNVAVEDNFARYPGDVYRVTVRDTGHYSFTDICGMPAPTAPGSCSAGPRQTNPTVSFEPLAIDRARSLVKQYVASFFERELLGRGPGPRGVRAGRDAVLEYKPAD